MKNKPYPALIRNCMSIQINIKTIPKSRETIPLSVPVLNKLWI
jgi:hypothetical protein